MLPRPTLGSMGRVAPMGPVSAVRPAGVSNTQMAPSGGGDAAPMGGQPQAMGSAGDAPPIGPPPQPMVPPPASPVPPVSSAPQGSPASTFGPGHDLLSTQINPNTGGPDRTALANQSVSDWETATAPQFAADQRAVGQNAAKFGRIGAGMTTNDLTGLEATHNRDRMLFKNQLASNLADATINDQRSNNNELRTERDYQTGRSDKATQDAIDQRNQEEALLNSGFGRALSTAQFGYGGSPVDTLSGFSGALGQSGAASTGAGVDLLSGRNKQQPFDFSSLLKYLPQGGTTTPSKPPISQGIVRNY